MTIDKIRRDYKRASLNKKDADLSPFKHFAKWIDEAIKADLIDATAMSISTSENNKPSSRMVLLKGYDESGFSFYTNYESKKGKEISANPNVALLFYWAELERQIRIEGRIEKLSEKENDEYFQSRPIESQISTWVSLQSSIVKNRKFLEDRYNESAKKFGKKVPRPKYWGGYKVIPNLFEFWQGRDSRLHDRIQYSKKNKKWIIERLAP
ncbi:MAG: pyridoxamine 5'-phosphate oxidase [Bacteroidetes bacterium]|nr:pyridoxamine 5'-phosphate oxidase [Bacteroidota bacterium]